MYSTPWRKVLEKKLAKKKKRKLQFKVPGHADCLGRGFAKTAPELPGFWVTPNLAQLFGCPINSDTTGITHCLHQVAAALGNMQPRLHTRPAGQHKGGRLTFRTPAARMNCNLQKRNTRIVGSLACWRQSRSPASTLCYHFTPWAHLRRQLAAPAVCYHLALARGWPGTHFSSQPLVALQRTCCTPLHTKQSFFKLILNFLVRQQIAQHKPIQYNTLKVHWGVLRKENAKELIFWRLSSPCARGALTRDLNLLPP